VGNCGCSSTSACCLLGATPHHMNQNLEDESEAKLSLSVGHQVNNERNTLKMETKIKFTLRYV
jgi:hypothetical protein